MDRVRVGMPATEKVRINRKPAVGEGGEKARLGLVLEEWNLQRTAGSLSP